MRALDAVLTLERPLLVALDVDGTLAPIVRDPDAAVIPPGTIKTLETLARSPTATVALITGRDSKSLSRMERLEGIWRGVEHGGVVLAPGELPSDRVLPEAQQEALDRFRIWTEEHGTEAWIEHKPGAIAVHVRALAETAPDRAEALLAEVEAFATSLGLHVRKGRSVREAEASRHDKGQALREIFARSRARSVFFAGDDLTDVPAIEFASANGVGAFVSSAERPRSPSAAAITIAGTEELATLLDSLSRELD
ncbi:MAG: trehalose-phosphatase [Polyangiales bacterium]